MRSSWSGLIHSSPAAPGPVVRKGTPAAVKLEAPFDTGAGGQAVLRQVVGYYHETLKESPEALKYLQGRGLDHPEIYAPGELWLSRPDHNRTGGRSRRISLFFHCFSHHFW